MLLRDDRQAALNAVESTCLESADGYAAAAENAKSAELGVDFDEAAQGLRRFASDLASHIRALGDLPQQPDPDREAFGHVLDTIKARLAADSDATLLEQRLAADAELELTVQTVLNEDLPDDTRAVLSRLLDEIAQRRMQLLRTCKH